MKWNAHEPTASGPFLGSATRSRFGGTCRWIRYLGARMSLRVCCAAQILWGLAAVAAAPERMHWAYRPIPEHIPPPTMKGEAPPSEHEIDRFIHAALVPHRVGLSPEARPHQLIRRLSLDLLGLPPSFEEVARFEREHAAHPESAWHEWVERYLASPHFGERWGRHWLDQARYADSDGYEKDSPRPDAWRYREWVIDSLNRDQPFDQFTLEQLAGDLLPDATPEQRLATAFHRQTLTNREGGVDQEQYRVEATFDRTETTATVWLGLTLGCARCHDHKYESISQREYFQFYAFFNEVEEANAKVGRSRFELEDYARAHAAQLTNLLALEAQMTQVRDRLAQQFLGWEQTMLAKLQSLEGKAVSATAFQQEAASSISEVSLTPEPDGVWAASPSSSNQTTYRFTAKVPLGELHGIQLEVLPGPSASPSAVQTEKEGSFLLNQITLHLDGNPRALHSGKADYEQKGRGVAGALDDRPESGWAVAPKADEPHQAMFWLHPPQSSDGTLRVEITLNQGTPTEPGQIRRFRLRAITQATEESLAPADVRRLARIGSEKWTEPDRERLLEWLTDLDPEARSLRTAWGQAQAKADAPLMTARVLRDPPHHRPTHVLYRGDFLQPREVVRPGVPQILPPLAVPRSGGQPKRLELARWLTSPENPLTARVAANQIWSHLMGEGLVRTPADFGVRGDPPTHPALLDWLAREFIRGGWSRKHLIRKILLSATYRQSSAQRSELLEQDPLNRWFARQNRLRVEGELVRDLQLSVGGLLNRRIGGASVYPPMPSDVAEISYANNFKWPESQGADRYRRGMYTFFKRTAPHPDLMTFDCPDANLTTVRRTLSNTPLQALTLLNAPAFTEAARALASRLLRESGKTDQQRLIEAFQHCLARAPQAFELTPLQRVLGVSRAFYADHPAEARRLGLGDERPDELAAWIATARVLLNADEFLTRE